jgi:hypothetical protein
MEFINLGLTVTIGFLAHQCIDVRIFQARYGPLVSTALILSVIVRRTVLHSSFQYAISSRARLGRHFEYRNSLLVHAQKQPRPRGVRLRRPRRKGWITYSSFFWIKNEDSLQEGDNVCVRSVIGSNRRKSDGLTRHTETGILTWYMYTHLCAWFCVLTCLSRSVAALVTLCLVRLSLVSVR